MKKYLLFASAALIFSACNKPTDRVAVINSKDAANILAISELNEMSEAKKSVLISTASADSITQMDADLKPVKIDSKAETVIKKVKESATKAVLDNQLKTGAVAILVLDKELKIFKVVKDPSAPAAPKVDPPPGKTDNAANTDAPAEEADAAATAAAEEAALEEAAANDELLTLKYLTQLKALAKTSDAKVQSDLAAKLADAKKEKPHQIGQKIGFVEITSIEIKRAGILDNERTDYGEKRSLLNVIEGPFEMATHILLGDEKKKPAKTSDAAEGNPAN